MERQTLGYILVLLIAAALFAYGAYRRHHGSERSYRRRHAQEGEAHRKIMEAKEENGRR